MAQRIFFSRCGSISITNFFHLSHTHSLVPVTSSCHLDSFTSIHIKAFVPQPYSSLEMNMNNVQNNTWKYIKTEETDCTDCASLRDPVTGELKVQPATTVQPFHKILLVGENIFLLHFYVLSTLKERKKRYT